MADTYYPVTSTSPITTTATDELGRTLILPALVWSEKVELACCLMAEGKPVRAVAMECDLTSATIRAWLKYPDFQNRMIELAGTYRREVLAYSVARVECRVAAYQEEFDAAGEEMKARAELMADDPLGRTGRMCKSKRQVGKGADAEIITEYTYDDAMVRRRMDILKQAAQDLGQWSEKRVLTGEDGGPIQVQAVALAKLLTPEQLDAAIAAMESTVERNMVEVTGGAEETFPK